MLPDMKRRQSGHMVVMTSIMGIKGVLVCVSQIAEGAIKRAERFLTGLLMFLHRTSVQ